MEFVVDYQQPKLQYYSDYVFFIIFLVTMKQIIQLFSK